MSNEIMKECFEYAKKLCINCKWSDNFQRHVCFPERIRDDNFCYFDVRDPDNQVDQSVEIRLESLRKTVALTCCAMMYHKQAGTLEEYLNKFMDGRLQIKHADDWNWREQIRLCCEDETMYEEIRSGLIVQQCLSD